MLLFHSAEVFSDGQTLLILEVICRDGKFTVVSLSKQLCTHVTRCRDLGAEISQNSIERIAIMWLDIPDFLGFFSLEE